jgi:hypothetical protein
MGKEAEGDPSEAKSWTAVLQWPPKNKYMSSDSPRPILWGCTHVTLQGGVEMARRH